MNTKYKASTWLEKDTGKEHYFVERTHPVYGWPAVEIPTQPQFLTKQAAIEYAKHLNNENEQLTLFK